MNIDSPIAEQIAVSKDEFAFRFDVSKRTVDVWLAKGMPHLKLSSRQVRILVQDGTEWIREQFSSGKKTQHRIELSENNYERKLVLNVCEAANMMGVAVGSVRKMLRQKRLPQIENIRKILIPKEAVIEFVKLQQQSFKESKLAAVRSKSIKINPSEFSLLASAITTTNNNETNH